MRRPPARHISSSNLGSVLTRNWDTHPKPTEVPDFLSTPYNRACSADWRFIHLVDRLTFQNPRRLAKQIGRI